MVKQENHTSETQVFWIKVDKHKEIVVDWLQKETNGRKKANLSLK